MAILDGEAGNHAEPDEVAAALRIGHLAQGSEHVAFGKRGHSCIL